MNKFFKILDFFSFVANVECFENVSFGMAQINKANTGFEKRVMKNIDEIFKSVNDMPWLKNLQNFVLKSGKNPAQESMMDPINLKTQYNRNNNNEATLQLSCLWQKFLMDETLWSHFEKYIWLDAGKDIEFRRVLNFKKSLEEETEIKKDLTELSGLLNFIEKK